MKEPFFDKCLKHEFLEGKNDVIRMPEDDLRAFEDLTGFLYFGKSSLEKFTRDSSDKTDCQKAQRLQNLYILAEKIGVEDLHNDIMDMCCDYNKYRPHTTKIDTIPQSVPMDCAWIRYRIAVVAWNLQHKGADAFGNGSSSFNQEAILNWFERGGDVVREVLRLLITRGPLKHPKDEGKCHWHIHQRTPKCDNA